MKIRFSIRLLVLIPAAALIVLRIVTVVELPKQRRWNMELVDSKGRVVASQDETASIDGPELEPGTYLVRRVFPGIADSLINLVARSAYKGGLSIVVNVKDDGPMALHDESGRVVRSFIDCERGGTRLSPGRYSLVEVSGKGATTSHRDDTGGAESSTEGVATGRNANEGDKNTGEAEKRSTHDPSLRPYPAPPPPIADADPAVRHEVRVKAPTALTVKRAGNTLSVSVDRKTVQSASVTVGAKMVTGVRSELFVYEVGDVRPPEPVASSLCGALNFNLGTSILNTKWGGIPAAGRQYIVEMELTIFETDIPVQHFWSPSRGRYRALWTKVLRATIE